MEVEILVKHKGRACGNPNLIESLQTESMSTLSLLCFLLCFYQFHKITLRHKICGQCSNNNTVVCQITWYQTCLLLPPNATIIPDYDVQAQIEQVLTDLQATWPIAHVKGHQTGWNLSWEAKLNIEADALATESKETLSMQARNLSPPLYPACHIGVYLNGQLLTWQIQRELQQAYMQVELITHVQEKFKWTKTTYYAIDWSTHDQNFRQFSYYSHKFLVKLIHECLLVRKASYNLCPVNTCLCCRVHLETNGHFLACPDNPEPWTALQSLLTPLYNKHSVDPVLRIIINHMLPDPATSVTAIRQQYPDIDWKSYKNLFIEETKIG
eukprot:15345335-Ditylum_brightwellii.AAC.1